MDGVINKLEAIVGEKRLRHNEPLTAHTVLKLDALAELYVEIDKQETLIKVIRAARESKMPVYLLGSGARIETDHNIAGLVIKNACRRFDKISTRGITDKGKEEIVVFAESGVIINQLVRYTIEEGLEGLEYQLGLPGTVGGAICTNAKYMPRYLMVNQALKSISILHEDGQVQSYTKELPYFVYTDDAWEETKDIILSAVFKLNSGDKKALWARGEEAVAWREEHYKK